MPTRTLPGPALVTLVAGALVLGVAAAFSPPAAAALALVGLVVVARALPRWTAAGTDPRPATPRVTPTRAAGVAGAAVLVGLVGAVMPAAALGVVVVGLVVALLAPVALPRLAKAAIVAAAVAGILGPNLALPQAPSLFGFRVIMAALGLGFVAYLLLDGRLAIPRGLPRPAGLLIAMNLWALVSNLWAEDHVAAARWTLFLAMMSSLAIGIALACRSRRNAMRLVAVLGVTFAFAALTGLAEIRLGIRLPTSALLGKSTDAATSLFGNQNNFATYLTLTLPYFLCLPVVFRDARLILVGAAGTVGTLASLMFTGSRSNLVAAALIVAGLVVFLVIAGGGMGRSMGLAIAALTVILVVPSLSGHGILPIPQEAVTKFNLGLLAEQRKQQFGSGAVREAVVQEGLGLVSDSGGLGVGAGNAEAHLVSLDAFTGVENVHNWWLEVLIDLGVVGLAAFVAAYLTLLRGQFRAARRSGDPFVRWLGLAGALALVGFLSGSMGPSSVIHFAPMWITLGLGMLTLILARAERQ